VFLVAARLSRQAPKEWRRSPRHAGLGLVSARNKQDESCEADEDQERVAMCAKTEHAGPRFR